MRSKLTEVCGDSSQRASTGCIDCGRTGFTTTVRSGRSVPGESIPKISSMVEVSRQVITLDPRLLGGTLDSG